MSAALFLLLLLSLLNSFYDYHWYTNRLVGIPFASVVAVSLLLGFSLLLRSLARNLPLRVTRETWTVVAFAGCCMLSIGGLYFNNAHTGQWMQFGRTMVHLLFYIYLVIVVQLYLANANVISVAVSYVSIGLLATVVALLQAVHLNLGGFGWMSGFLFGCPIHESSRLMRVASVFPEPSWFGFSVVDWLALVTALFLIGANRWFCFVAMALLAIGLVLANSMGAYISITVYAGLLVSMHFRRIGLRFWLGLVVLLIVMGVLFFTSSAGNEFMIRIGEITAGRDASTRMRLASTTAALMVWMENPLVGAGLGNGQFVIPQFFENEFLKNTAAQGGFTTSYGSDSFWALLLAETGIVGAIGFCVMIIMFTRLPTVARPHTQMRQLHGSVKAGRFEQILYFYFCVRCVVILEFIQLSFTGSFLTPRLWFNVAMLLALKMQLRRFEGATASSPAPSRSWPRSLMTRPRPAV